ncbi:hypothetical protein KsCSTR_32570 [Candidatus Kuenenia stuttgartiensis]|uniref:Uncharacterized protein n=1 Tax=Kuenenia stuttgartiensis TaxID=174633 RepID=A0A6G7GSU1_KUEST|nr:hypothetical protein KsCSTR_32570 [Candidatus Kuenenia stuttgartiensis]
MTAQAQELNALVKTISLEVNASEGEHH